MSMSKADLPLRYHTGDNWAKHVLEQPLELLNDHAHLEKKAAANALELLNRWPEPAPPENWVSAMTAIARDEVEHLAVVCRILARRGGRLTKQHTNPYASQLRLLVRKGEGRDELVDRLMVSALIEARSCERFKLLADTCDDVELAKLYRGLWGSEHGTTAPSSNLPSRFNRHRPSPHGGMRCWTPKRGSSPPKTPVRECAAASTFSASGTSGGVKELSRNTQNLIRKRLRCR